jgi:hypothetical protein
MHGHTNVKFVVRFSSCSWDVCISDYIRMNQHRNEARPKLLVYSLVVIYIKMFCICRPIVLTVEDWKHLHLSGTTLFIKEIYLFSQYVCLLRLTVKPLYVRGSVHNSIIHIGNTTRCNFISTFYFIFIWSSTCDGRHTAHHQEPKTAPAVSGFVYVEGCWACSC